MKVIGITGGVGSGKSAVLKLLEEEYHAVVVQLDEVAKALQRKGTPCWKAIVEAFGREILDENEELDRKKLAQIVFQSSEKLEQLNGIVHPAVKQQVLLDIEEKRKEKTELYVLEAALLLEAGYAKICEETWFIYTEESVRRERLKASRGYSDERITDMIRSQSPEAYFRKNCTRVIDNSREIEDVGSDNTHLLIDTGISKKRIDAGLKELEIKGEELDGILITHEHSDHIQGLGVFSRKYEIPIYATPGTIAGIQAYSRLGAMPEGLYHVIHSDESFMLGDIRVNPFAISHDANEPTGYRLECRDKSVAVATDLGIYDAYTVSHLQNLDAVLLEANHDLHMLEVGPYPYPLKRRVMGDKGHLSNELSGRLLCDILHDNLKHIVLGHLSKENNYESLAYETVKLEVTLGDNAYKGEDLNMAVAKRDSISEIITV